MSVGSLSGVPSEGNLWKQANPSQPGRSHVLHLLTHAQLYLHCSPVHRGREEREGGRERGKSRERGGEGGREKHLVRFSFLCSDVHQSAQDTEQFLSDEDPHVVLITASTFLLSSLNSAAWCLWGLSGSSVRWEFLQPPEGLTMCSFFVEEPEDQDICRDTLLPYRTRELHPKCLTVWLPNHDLNNDSTSWSAIVENKNLTRTYPSMKSYKPLVAAKRRKVSLPQK